MKNIKLFKFAYVFIFISIIMQILLLTKLNSIYGSLNKTKSVVTPQSSEADVTTDNSIHTSDTNQENNQTSSYGIRDYSDIDSFLTDENLSANLTNTLFIGDSRTEGLLEFTDADNYADFCCGVGYKISDITNQKITSGRDSFEFLNTIAGKQYSKIIISLGYNELGWTYEDKYIEKYLELINEIKSASPNTKIYVQLILHISADSNVSNDSENNDRIDLFNSKLIQMCNNNKLDYIDLNSYFTDNSGYLLPDSSTDGIHFNVDYCKKYLYQLLKEF